MAILRVLANAFTRRFRDRWNRALLKRVAETKAHTLKIKAKLRAKGARANWFNERKCAWFRRKARTQNLWVLHLAGDFHPSFEHGRPSANPHLMRVFRVVHKALSTHGYD